MWRKLFFILKNQTFNSLMVYIMNNFADIIIISFPFSVCRFVVTFQMHFSQFVWVTLI